MKQLKNLIEQRVSELSYALSDLSRMKNDAVRFLIGLLPIPPTWFWNGIVAGENAKFVVKSAVSQNDFVQGKVSSASDLGIEWQQNM